ncbi:MAG: TonB-dependent receptor plug domain-containing protein, partial [Chitinivibrionales bacterium]|nr:TonB-dependent receptor plug domain-containing protein [Chitinivibrionales bacterium]
MITKQRCAAAHTRSPIENRLCLAMAVCLHVGALLCGAFGSGRKEDSLTVVGTVRDAETGEAIVGSVLFHDASYVASTDMSGSLAYRCVRTRKATITVLATGFASFDTTLRRTGATDTISLTVPLRKARHLNPGSKVPSSSRGLPIVVGRALDAVTGKPVRGVHVRTASQVVSMQTGEMGIFGGVVYDSQMVFSFSHPDYRDTSMGVAASPQDRFCEVALRLSPRVHPEDTTGTIRGEVLDAHTGEPVAGAGVLLGGTDRRVETDSTGSFLFSFVRPGTYPLLVHSWGGEMLGAVPRASVQHGDTVDLIVQMTEREAGMDVSGRQSSLIVSVVDGDGIVQDPTVVVLLPDSLWKATDTAGRVQFDSLAAGTYSLLAILSGRDTVSRAGVDLSAGEERSLVLEAPRDRSEDTSHTSNVAIIEGIVVDAIDQTPVPGVRVRIPTAGVQTVTDTQGRYSVSLRRDGAHTVVIEHDGFTVVTETIQTGRGKTAQCDALLTTSDVTAMSRMVIRGVAVKNTGASVLAERQVAINVSDNLSMEDMSRAGASNAADALKMIPGVTLIEGKYPIIRGLGDRYIVSLMNGMRLPSPNPDRPVITFDLFPTALLDNVTMRKTYTPDMWGDFSAGTVELNLRAPPDTLAASFSAGVGVNDVTTFRQDFLTYEGGTTDWLGVDDGTRALPEALDGDDVWTPSYYDPLLAASDPDSALGIIARIDQVATAFDNAPLAGEDSMARPNQSYGGMVGGTVGDGETRLGVLASVSYANNLSSTADEVEGVWYLGVHDTLADSLTLDRQFNSRSSTEEVLWGALLNLALTIRDGHVLSGVYTYTRASEDETRQLVSDHYLQIEDPNVHLVHNEIRYVERGLHFGYLGGEHVLPLGDEAKLEWMAAVADGVQNEPDYRVSTMVVEYRDDDTAHSIRRSLGSTPSHRYRYTRETSGDLRVDLTVPFRQWTGAEGFVKAGLGWQSKKREFWQ